MEIAATSVLSVTCVLPIVKACWGRLFAYARTAINAATAEMARLAARYSNTQGSLVMRLHPCLKLELIVIYHGDRRLFVFSLVVGIPSLKMLEVGQ